MQEDTTLEPRTKSWGAVTKRFMLSISKSNKVYIFLNKKDAIFF